MKIAMIHFATGVREGGAETIVKNLSYALSRRGHDVHIYTLHGEIKFDSCVTVHTIPYVPVPVGHWDYLSSMISFSFFAAMSMIRRRFDVIHAFFYLDAKIPFFFSNLAGAKTVFTFCGVLDKESSAGKAADRAVALTSISKRLYEKLGVKNVRVIPNGVDSGIRPDKKIRSRVRKKLGIRGPAVISVARPDIIKDPNLMKDIIINSDRRIKFILVGISESEPLKSMDAPNVIKLGTQPHSEVMKYYQAADAFLLTSRSEGFPGVLLEAMAFGLPIFATKVGGVPDVVDENVGFFIPRDGKEAAKMLEKFLKNEKLMKTLSRNAAERASEHGWENIAKMYENVYKS